jgi:hypothetical protein
MSTGSRNRWRRSGARKKWAINAFPRRQTKAESRRRDPRRNHTRRKRANWESNRRTKRHPQCQIAIPQQPPQSTKLTSTVFCSAARGLYWARVFLDQLIPPKSRIRVGMQQFDSFYEKWGIAGCPDDHGRVDPIRLEHYCTLG